MDRKLVGRQVQQEVPEAGARVFSFGCNRLTVNRLSTQRGQPGDAPLGPVGPRGDESACSRHAMRRRPPADVQFRLFRASRIVAHSGQTHRRLPGTRIIENWDRFGHSDSVPSKVDPGFSLLVPLESHCFYCMHYLCRQLEFFFTLTGASPCHCSRVPILQTHWAGRSDSARCLWFRVKGSRWPRATTSLKRGRT